VEKENVDPVYEYIDEKVEALKRELQQLRFAHDATANLQAQELLELQRMAASLKLNADVSDFRPIIEQLRKSQTINTQMLTDASAIKQQIITSSEPIKLATDFRVRWVQKLQDSGAEFITY
jgi:hypothetical protein